MLSRLYVRNYTLIEELDVSFEKGFSVISGETGAGKSIIIGALGLLMGKRLENSPLFDPQKKCIIEAGFDVPAAVVSTLLAEHELDEEFPLLLRREISPNGKSRAFVNDTPVNLRILKKFGALLLHIHSQHQSMDIKEPDFQLSSLDAFAGNKNGLAAYREIYHSYRALEKELNLLKQSEEKARSEQDYFRFLFDELDAAQLDAQADAQLEQELEMLENIGDIRQALGAFSYEVNEQENSILSTLKMHENQLLKIASFNNRFEELAQRLHSLIIELDDLATASGSELDDLHLDEGRKEEISERLDMIQKLQFKHNKNSIAELIALYNEIDERLGAFQSLGHQIREKEKQLKSMQEQLDAAAQKLHAKREKSAPKLAGALMDTLRSLGMPDVDFRVHLSMMDKYTPRGSDEIVFLFSANKGKSPENLGLVASGGEMSRIMLAMQSLISSTDAMPCLVFDEIDTGISGNTALKVASIMKKLSEKQQLLAITHLPQVAAKADFHYQVYKESARGQTISRLKCLSGLERINEIAQMMSGSTNDEALKAAQKLIENH